MSTDEPESAFWSRVDRFIDLANDQSRDADKGRVSAALLYAAARHNAFHVASSARDQAHLRANLEEAIRHNVEQYRNMLTHNLQEYADHFGEYVTAQRRG